MTNTDNTNPTTPPNMGPRQLRTVSAVAAMLGVTDRSVRNYISRGLIPAYRIVGTRGVRIDQRDVERAMKLIPTVAPPKSTFGAGANIIDIPRQVEYVTPTPGREA